MIDGRGKPKICNEFRYKYLDKFSIHLVRESVHLTASLGISKTMPLATMSQQAHAS